LLFALPCWSGKRIPINYIKGKMNQSGQISWSYPKLSLKHPQSMIYSLDYEFITTGTDRIYQEIRKPEQDENTEI